MTKNKCCRCDKVYRITYKGNDYCWEHFDEVRVENPATESPPIEWEGFLGIA